MIDIEKKQIGKIKPRYLFGFFDKKICRQIAPANMNPKNNNPIINTIEMEKIELLI